MLQFDKSYYLAQNPDVAALGVCPEAHYNAIGYLEGRNPSPYFDTAYYLSENPDVVALGVNPFVHFNAIGAFEGRNPCSSVDVASVVAFCDAAACDDVRFGAVPAGTEFYLQRSFCEDVAMTEDSVCAELTHADDFMFEDVQMLNALVATFACSLIAGDVLADDSDLALPEAPLVAKPSENHEDAAPVGVLVVVGEAASQQLHDESIFAPAASNDNAVVRQRNFAVHQNLYVPKSMRVSMGELKADASAMRSAYVKSHHHDPTLKHWQAGAHLYDTNRAVESLMPSSFAMSVYPYDKLMA